MSLSELRHRLRHQEPGDGARAAESARRTERPEFHMLLVLEEGLLWHMVDFTDYAVEVDWWLWMHPGQVQQFGDLDAAVGTLLLFQADFLDPVLAAQVRLDDPFEPTVWPVAGAGASALAHALEDVVRELRASRLPASTRSAVLQHQLAVLLLRLTDRSAPVGSVFAEHSETFRWFRAAVENDDARARDVGHCARRLGCSPRTLTRATLAAAGVGAKEFIDRRVILEARRFLAHGDQPVAGIAARRGVLDVSNFVKYFARRVGTTPAAFQDRFRDGSSG